ncbi:hypothetical protein [Halobacterium noricense]|uniref:hypothetical protein n=1 Tax=Halobacterium noricense TaxID=223182 RepID=UPI001E2A4183|nr:hypothetical protein [Halobacterium noricense]UHH26442.1 hypothetical protein LT974_05770 [Halobacterium noricense]
MAEIDLEEELAEYDESVHDLIEELLTAYFKGEEEATRTASAVRRRRTERELDNLRARKKEIQESISDFEDELDLLSDSVSGFDNAVVDEALDESSNIRGGYRKPTNDFIQEQADKAGLDVEKFLELLEKRYPTNWRGDPIESTE